MPLTVPEAGAAAGASTPEGVAVEALSAGATVMQQRATLQGSFMQSAMASACSVFVEDVSHHLVDSPDVNSELLLLFQGKPPRRLALFPIHTSDGTLFGGLYLVSAMPVPFAAAQPDIETFLAVCSSAIVAAMQGVS